jgi:hypothetical protein
MAWRHGRSYSQDLRERILAADEPTPPLNQTASFLKSFDDGHFAVCVQNKSAACLPQMPRPSSW